MRPIGNTKETIAAAQAASPFLRGLVRRFPNWPEEYESAGPDTFLKPALAEPKDDVAAELRQARARTAFGVAVADLSGTFALTQTVSALSDFADHAVRAALADAFEARTGSADTSGLAVVALGKLGSRELNYSSDIDLLYLFDGERIACRKGEDPGEAAQRTVRQMGETLQRRTKEGYVARVDLRLRPDAESFGLATPIRRAEIYYQSEALTWERAALIKARVIAGDEALGAEFLNAVRPFVWRRALDYTAVQSIEDMSLRIRDHFEGAERFGPGFDVKRGRGGIREIEFFTQAHQLIFAGREPNLRVADTREALRRLAAAGRVEEAHYQSLSDAYEALRHTEHRLQMIDDQQTHAIPQRKEEREALAHLSGFRRFADLASHLKPKIETARDLYTGLLETAERPPVPRGRALSDWLTEQKLPARKEFQSMIERWRGGGLKALRSEAAQRELERALPVVVRAFGQLTTPQNALRRFDDFLGRVPTATRVFSLLAANPPIAEVLAKVMGHAPRLASAFARHPDLLDVLIGGAADPLDPAGDLDQELGAQLARAGSMEAALDTLRHWSRDHRFRIGVRLIERRLHPLAAARAYSDVADAVIAGALRLVSDEFAEDYGRVPGGEPVVLAFGRYGGRALTEESDLDLVFLYSGSHDAHSNGDKPHSATVYFNRLFQRLVSALTVPTAVGPLYEVDTRLRPSGAQGALVVSIDSFAGYQTGNAWSWEHMALTRARVVAGEDDASEAAAAAIRAGLMRPHDADKLRGEVTSMRADMHAAHPKTGPLDVKRGAGGLIDLEFVVHYLQLTRKAGLDPDLRKALDALIAEHALPPEMLEAHDLMQSFLVVMRLVGEEATGRHSAVTRDLVAKICGLDNWSALTSALADAQRTVKSEWNRYLGEKSQ